jgi:hypothetical protein
MCDDLKVARRRRRATQGTRTGGREGGENAVAACRCRVAMEDGVIGGRHISLAMEEDEEGLRPSQVQRLGDHAQKLGIHVRMTT